MKKKILLTILCLPVLMSGTNKFVASTKTLSGSEALNQSDSLKCLVLALEKTGNQVTVDSLNGKKATLIVESKKGLKEKILFDCVGERILSKTFIKDDLKSHPLKRIGDGAGDEGLTTSFNYNDKGLISEINSPFGNYQYAYNEENEIIGKYIHDIPIEIISKPYLTTETKAFSNGDVLKKYKNDNNKVTSTFENNEKVFAYTYNRNNQVSKFKDLKTGLVSEYVYNADSKLEKTTSNQGYEINYSYENDEIKERNYNFGNDNIKVEYNEEGIVVNDLPVVVRKDIAERPVEIEYGPIFQNRHYIEYEPMPDDLAYVSESQYDEYMENLTDDAKMNFFYTNYHAYEFDMDDAGNVCYIRENRYNNYTYDYDIQNQLIYSYTPYGENTYEYDERGNVISHNDSVMTYTLTNTFDLLTSINGTTLTYDGSGNLIEDGGNTYEWFGNKLTGINQNIHYNYDAKGIRNSKTVNGLTTYYYTEGSKVIWEKTDGDVISYFYNKNDIIGLKYQGQNYYYIKNAFNDIVGIVDEEGQLVVEYGYDDWGNLVHLDGIMGDTLGGINPYRFKSARYDWETGFYYLESRYYNPEYGRFISPDDLSNLELTLLGTQTSMNLYAYANNNPINSCDPKGNSAVWALNLVNTLYTYSGLVPDSAVGPLMIILNGLGFYTAFHETAQIISSKIIKGKGYSGIELEHKTPQGNEIDVWAKKGGRNYIWEVKPLGTSPMDQLTKYASQTGASFGTTFAKKEVHFHFDRLIMRVECPAPGCIYYSFWKKTLKWFFKTQYVQVTNAQVKNKLNVTYWIGIIAVGAVLIANVVENVASWGSGTADDALVPAACAGAFNVPPAAAWIFA